MKNEHFATQIASEFGAAVRANPAPAALIGMGLVWLFSGRSSVKAGLGGAVDGMADMSSRAGDRVRDLGRTIGATAKTVGQSAGDAFARKSLVAASSPTIDLAAIRANVTDLIQRQPMVFGAIGLVIGAGVASALPPTVVEADMLGDASANLQDAAREFATEATRRAAAVADGVTTTIAQEVRVQGLTPDGLKDSANEASRRVDRFISQSTERLRARMN
jgi:hypothetical protein